MTGAKAATAFLAAVLLGGCAQTKSWIDRVSPGDDESGNDNAIVGAPNADDYLLELERLATGDPATPFNGNEVLGHDLHTDRSGVRRRVGFVGHAGGLYGDLTVHENLEMGGYVRDDDLTPRLQEIYEIKVNGLESLLRPFQK